MAFIKIHWKPIALSLALLLLATVGRTALGLWGQAAQPLPMEESAFTEEQQRWTNEAKSLCIAGVQISQPPTEAQKAAFLHYMLAHPMYKDKVLEWQRSAEDYAIPLADMEQILFTHLDTNTFDPTLHLPLPHSSNRYYDPQAEEYHLPMLGGFGGAQAFGVLEYTERPLPGGNQVEITLGIFDMELFFNEPRQYNLLETYTVIMETTPDGSFKVLYAM